MIPNNDELGMTLEASRRYDKKSLRVLEIRDFPTFSFAT
jgi:hypothetical protein